MNRKPPQWKTKQCARCGETFSTMTGKTKYCNDCRPIVARERESERYRKAVAEGTVKKSMKGKPRFCQTCGAEITGTRARKFCSKCSPWAGIDDTKGTYEKFCASYKTKRKSQIDEKIRAAMKAHVSYGKYVAMKEAGRI